MTTGYSETVLKSATIKSQPGTAGHLENRISQCTHTAPPVQEPPGERPTGAWLAPGSGAAGGIEHFRLVTVHTMKAAG